MRIPVAIIIISYLAVILSSVYIFADIRKYARSCRPAALRALFGGVTALLLLALTFCFCLPKRSADSGILYLMWTLYAVLSVVTAEVIYILCSAVGRFVAFMLGRRGGRRRSNPGIYAGLALGAVTVISMWWGVLYTRHHIRVIHTIIESPRVPDAFDGYRVVQLSDIHTGTWNTDTTFVSNLVDSVNACRPDMIVFTGDIVNRRTSELAPFLRVLSRLKARDGVYSILGNHDYGDYIDWSHPSERDANNALLAAWEKQMGWTLLNNDHRFIRSGNDSIALIGVENWGDPPFKQYGDLNAAYPALSDIRHLNDSTFKILLTHNPAHWEQEVVRLSNIDLTLSGHTHAMQMMLEAGDWKWSPAVFRYEKWGGLYKARDPKMQLYVNIGSGEVGMPARIGTAYPEITLLELKKTR